MTKQTTPLWTQYLRIKKDYSDCILFFRVGDFYETFADDAVKTARALDITLTKKHMGKGNVVPLAGVPYHSYEQYAARLIRKGFRVAICEQVEDPKTAKGLVKRDVVRLITAGTLTEQNLLEETSNNYILSCAMDHNLIGLAFADISTGEFKIVEFEDDPRFMQLRSFISRLQPAEILVEEEVASNTSLSRLFKETLNSQVTPIEEHYFSAYDATKTLCSHFQTNSLEGFGIHDTPVALTAASALLKYFQQTQKSSLKHLNKIEYYHTHDFMALDETTQRSLELISPLYGSDKKATLYHVLNATQTSPGARLLKRILLEPLLDKRKIEKRHEKVEFLYQNYLFREKLYAILNQFPDLERLVGKLSLNRVNARDLLALKNALEKIMLLKELLQDSPDWFKNELGTSLDSHENIIDLLKQSIHVDPPMTIREGGIIRQGYNSELDELLDMTHSNKKWILQLQQQEIKNTGISSLKIGFNKVFGYYIEVTKSNLKQIPSHYIRKQTLVNAERYITPDLKEKENLILSAEEKSKELEYRLFQEICENITRHISTLLTSGRTISWLDVYTSMATVAVRNRYIRPVLNENGPIQIIQSRHPVVEQLLIDEQFIPNDVYLDHEKQQIMLITGPNMAGKSTYIRQVALVTLMAQTGSFVPADKADIRVVDRIFTRVGASDLIARGQSTFMVEMLESANILNNATSNSLVILDEIGRGTSTYDGLSIAWAVIQYLATEPGKKPLTLFATHYHELTELESQYTAIKNYNVAVLEENNRVVFLYTIKPGGTDHSYGIYAAHLAGIPDKVIQNACIILSSLEEKGKAESWDIARRETAGREKKVQLKKLPLAPGMEKESYSTQKVIAQIKSLDIQNMTPLQALNQLAKLKKLLFKKDDGF